MPGAELIIGGISAVALLGLFQTLTTAYDTFIRSARSLGRTAYNLSISLLVEKQKLLIWGEHLGITNSQGQAQGQCILLQRQSYETQRTVVWLLESVKVILDDADAVMARYGVVVVQATTAAAEGKALSLTERQLELRRRETGLQDLNLTSMRECEAVRLATLKRLTTERSIQASVSRMRKLRWALSDSKKLDQLAKDLRKINENLWIALPFNSVRALAKGLPTVVLPQIMGQGNEEEFAEVLREVGRNERGRETGRFLEVCAELRSVAEEVARNEKRPNFGEALRLHLNCVVDKIELVEAQKPGVKIARRTDANIESQRLLALIEMPNGERKRVLIEWRHVDWNLKVNDVEKVKTRIKALAVLLNARKSSEFGILRCIGFYKHDLVRTERYALVLELPGLEDSEIPSVPRTLSLTEPRPKTLHEYINTTKPPELGDRFKIASALCHTVLQLHASSWLHKAICASSVLFLYENKPEGEERLNITKPFLVGFDFSRPDRPSAESLDFSNNRTFNHYRHPALWTATETGEDSEVRYRKAFDIYSLGVLLLEVGMWSLMEKSGKEHRDEDNPAKWRSHLLDRAESLGARCGRIYKEVVVTCLTGTFTETEAVMNTGDMGVRTTDNSVRSSFLFDVVYKLGACYA